MTSNFKYLGDNVGLIHNLFAYYAASAGSDEALKQAAYAKLYDAIRKDVAANANLALIAITADFYQAYAHVGPEETGFRKVMRFLSTHSNPKEILTLWVRENRKAANTAYPPAGDPPPHNCSVMFNTPGPRMTIVTKNPKSEQFKRIRGATVWYKIDPKHVIKVNA